MLREGGFEKRGEKEKRELLQLKRLGFLFSLAMYVMTTGEKRARSIVLACLEGCLGSFLEQFSGRRFFWIRVPWNSSFCE